jgi:hypothetical protein
MPGARCTRGLVCKLCRVRNSRIGNSGSEPNLRQVPVATDALPVLSILAARYDARRAATTTTGNDRTNCSSALNLRNAPNPLPARRLQQMLGGEYHETCFCTCWPRRTWRGCFIQRGRICDAHRRPGLDDGNRCPVRLRLQRMGPLLAPPLLRWRLLPSALLGWLRLAPSLGRQWRLASSLGLWRRVRLASALGWWLGWRLRLASLASVVITEKGASAPFFFRMQK